MDDRAGACASAICTRGDIKCHRIRGRFGDWKAQSRHVARLEGCKEERVPRRVSRQDSTSARHRNSAPDRHVSARVALILPTKFGIVFASAQSIGSPAPASVGGSLTERCQMRFYDRSRVPAPRILDSSRAAEMRAQIQSYLALPDDERRQSRPLFDVTFMMKELKPALMSLFGGCCAYCESPISSTSFGDIDQHRPKTNAADRDRRTSLLGGK
jgi:hypothetical protein